MDRFANLCRLCRTKSETVHDWHDVLADNNVHLSDKIEACTSVQIRESDCLPKMICDLCRTTLDQAYSFRLQCQETDARWQNELANIGTLPVTSIYVKSEIEEDSGKAELLKDELVSEPEDEPLADEFGRDSPETEEPRNDKPKASNRKNRFQCSMCSRSFNRKCRLREHELRHNGVRTVECQKCDRKFFTEKDLGTHVERMHSFDLGYSCDKCGKGFSSKGQLTNHWNTHVESREFICDTCSKSFKTKYHLKIHVDTHLPKELRKERKKPNLHRICVCSYCGKISTTITTHNMHLRTHTGEQPYECNICNKRFTASFSHKNHMRVHSDERPFRCDQCIPPKGFRQRHHLANHIRSTHTNERPYQCRYCSRTFVTRGNMKLHERIHGEPVKGAVAD